MLCRRRCRHVGDPCFARAFADCRTQKFHVCHGSRIPRPTLDFQAVGPTTLIAAPALVS